MHRLFDLCSHAAAAMLHSMPTLPSAMVHFAMLAATIEQHCIAFSQTLQSKNLLPADLKQLAMLAIGYVCCESMRELDSRHGKVNRAVVSPNVVS